MIVNIWLLFNTSNPIEMTRYVHFDTHGCFTHVTKDHDEKKRKKVGFIMVMVGSLKTTTVKKSTSLFKKTWSHKCKET